MTLGDFIFPLLITLVGLIGGFVGFFVRAWIDRREKIRARHFDVHVDMVQAIGKLASAFMGYYEMKDAQSEYAIAKLKYSVVASDNAVRALSRIDAFFSTKKRKNADEVNKAIVDFMRVARAENLGRSTLSDADLLGASPFVQIADGGQNAHPTDG